MNEFERIPELSLQQRIIFPKEVWNKFYTAKGDEVQPLFTYLTIEGVNGFEGIPVYTFVFNSIELGFLDVHQIPLEQYLKGFLQGVNDEFKTSFVDAPETRKEIVLRLINKGTIGFPVSNEIIKDGVVKTYESATIYEYGLEIGKIYKAWYYVFQSPEFFKDAFKNETPKEKPTFAAYLIHNKAKELADKLSPYITKGKGKHVALCLKALNDTGLLNFSKPQNVYDSLNLNESQCKGANDFFNVNSKSLLKDTDLNTYKTQIQSIIDTL